MSTTESSAPGETGSTNQTEAPSAEDAASFAGPLRSEAGSRYLVDQNGDAVLLVGSHTWRNLQEYGPELPIEAEFDYVAFLDFLSDHSHNFFRLWTWEQAAGGSWTTDGEYYAPNRYARTGPELSVDGRPAFDLDQFDDEYFRRLSERVSLARDRGLIVAVMLFNGWSIDDKGTGPGNACPGHPFFGGNNVNGVDADIDGNGLCEEVHTLEVPEVTRYQEAYVRRVIETVGDFDNVVFEISNESHGDSDAWQYHMIDYIRSVEADRPMQHVVGMSSEWPDGDNAELFASDADWIAPNWVGGYQDDPPPADGSKVTVLDTDHLWGVGGNGDWVWRAVTRGHNVLYMDCYDDYDEECSGSAVDPDRLSALVAMGQARLAAESIDLVEALPDPQRCSTGYCLVDDSGPDRSALVYAPAGGQIEVTIDASGLVVDVLDIAAGEWSRSTAEVRDGTVSVTLALDTPAAVLVRSQPG